jgi:hypothetical protein
MRRVVRGSRLDGEKLTGVVLDRSTSTLKE